MAVTRHLGERSDGRRSRDETRDDARPEPAWHEKTSTLAGASVAAIVVLALLYFLISTMAREFNDPEPVRQYFIEPTTSGSQRPSGSSTTSQTITSTVPPVTSDINPGESTTSSSTETSTRLPTTRRPTIGRDDDDGPTTTRSRPRLNETRTLYPQP